MGLALIGAIPRHVYFGGLLYLWPDRRFMHRFPKTANGGLLCLWVNGGFDAFCSKTANFAILLWRRFQSPVIATGTHARGWAAAQRAGSGAGRGRFTTGEGSVRSAEGLVGRATGALKFQPSHVAREALTVGVAHGNLETSEEGGGE